MVIHVRSVYLIFGSFQISFSKRYSKYMFRIYIGMSIFLIINILITSIYLILAELHGSSKNQNSQEISCHSEQVFSFQNSFYYRLKSLFGKKYTPCQKAISIFLYLFILSLFCHVFL